MATIRSYIFIDQLQPKTMCYLGSFIRGFLPRVNMAALVVEAASASPTATGEKAMLPTA